MAQVSTLSARAVVVALHQALGFVPFFAFRGVLIDHRKGYLETRRMGLTFKVFPVDALTAARLLYGPHPDRAVELLRRETGWPVLRCLKELGAHRADAMEKQMARTLASHGERRRAPRKYRQLAHEGDPEHGAPWPNSSPDDLSTN